MFDLDACFMAFVFFFVQVSDGRNILSPAVVCDKDDKTAYYSRIDAQTVLFVQRSRLQKCFKSSVL